MARSLCRFLLFRGRKEPSLRNSVSTLGLGCLPPEVDGFKFRGRERTSDGRTLRQGLWRNEL